MHTSSMKSSSIVRLTQCAMFSAVICVCSVFTIFLPISPAPITFQTFAIFLAGCILGKKYGVISVLVYILLGAVGLPVFSGLRGGLGILFGPTGGFIWGFAFAVFIIGYCVERVQKKDKISNEFIFIFLACILGMIVVYTFGTLWLMYLNHLSLGAALMVAVVPFILADLLKIFLAVFVFKRLRSTSNFMGSSL